MVSSYFMLKYFGRVAFMRGSSFLQDDFASWRSVLADAFGYFVKVGSNSDFVRIK
jgi:hypothetical protein